MKDSQLYKKVLNAMSAQIAILDENGIIVETNKSWNDFCLNNGGKAIGETHRLNYLEVCEQSTDPAEDGPRVAAGIRRVLRGEIDEFLMQYPCHSPMEKRWYVVRVVPYKDEGDEKIIRIIVSHENITPIVEVQKILEEKEVELKLQKEKLEDTNIALRVLLEQRDEDKKHMESAVFMNIDRLVLPYVDKLSTSQLSDRQKNLIDILQENLREIVSPFLNKLASLEARLTPQEIEVANLIRSGKTSKEIAEVLFLSVAGVDFHRKNLRKKLGLTHSRNNLRSYLMSMS